MPEELERSQLGLLKAGKWPRSSGFGSTLSLTTPESICMRSHRVSRQPRSSHFPQPRSRTVVKPPPAQCTVITPRGFRCLSTAIKHCCTAILNAKAVHSSNRATSTREAVRDTQLCEYSTLETGLPLHKRVITWGELSLALSLSRGPDAPHTPGHLNSPYFHTSRTLTNFIPGFSLPIVRPLQSHARAHSPARSSL